MNYKEIGKSLFHTALMLALLMLVLGVIDSFTGIGLTSWVLAPYQMIKNKFGGSNSSTGG